jgi:hypothetical protein
MGLQGRLQGITSLHSRIVGVCSLVGLFGSAVVEFCCQWSAGVRAALSHNVLPFERA